MRVLITLALAVIALSLFFEGPEQKVVFLDVGQGDSILLQDGTRQILVDGGPGQTVLERLGEEMPAFDKTIDAIILTHPDKDHLEGLLHVLERYDVGLVLMPEVRHDSRLQATWIDMLLERKTPVMFARPGQEFSSGDMKVDVLAPLPGFSQTAKTNNASTAVRADFGDMSFLLTGDMERKAERALAAEYGSALDVDVLKAGHHGSNTSTHGELLQAADPAGAVVSVGENSYGHPHPKALERLAGLPVWRTDEMGSVRFARLDDKWHVVYK